MEAEYKGCDKKKSIQVNLVCNTVVSLWVLDAKPKQNKTGTTTTKKTLLEQVM